MRNFKLISQNIEIGPLLAEIRRAGAEAWMVDTRRQRRIPALMESEALVLREVRRNGPRGAYHQETYATPMFAEFPRLLQMLFQLAAARKSTLTKITIARLAPQSHILPHIDPGGFFDKRDRFHLVLSAKEGNCLRCGGDTVQMKPGELWWFNNKKLHSASNFSDRPRIHVIFDLLPWTEQRPVRSSFCAPMCEELAHLQFSLQAQCVRWTRTGQLRVRGEPLWTDRAFLKYSWARVEKLAAKKKASMLVFTSESRPWVQALVRLGLLPAGRYEMGFLDKEGRLLSGGGSGLRQKSVLVSFWAPQVKTLRRVRKHLSIEGLDMVGVFSVLNLEGEALDRELRSRRLRPEFLLRAQDLDLPRLSLANRTALRRSL